MTLYCRFGLFGSLSFIWVEIGLFQYVRGCEEMWKGCGWRDCRDNDEIWGVEVSCEWDREDKDVEEWVTEVGTEYEWDWMDSEKGIGLALVDVRPSMQRIFCLVSWTAIYSFT